MTPRFQRNNIQKLLKRTQDNLQYDWILVLAIGLICIFGLAFLASSLSTKSTEIYQSEITKQLVLGLGLGGIFTVFLATFDYHKLLSLDKWFLWLNYGLLGFLAPFALYTNLVTWGKTAADAALVKIQVIDKLGFLPIKPHLANGAIRWIDFPVLPNFQPSEFTKLALLIYFSAFFWKYEGKKIDWIKFKKPIYSFLFSAILIIIQPDLGTVLIIFGILASAMWSAKIPLKILVYLGTVVVAIGLFMSLTVSYRLSRITAFLDPTKESAAQINGVQNAIRNGGLFGKGYGNSEIKQQPGILYEQSTDAIISIIGEESGFVGTVAFLSLYFVFFWRGLKIAREAPDLGGQALATGITVWIISQSFLNIAGMLGLAPLKGIPLPFVSEGGSSLFVNLIAVGILLNISKQAKPVAYPATKPKPITSSLFKNNFANSSESISARSKYV
jgi:cell division protein FtsW